MRAIGLMLAVLAGFSVGCSADVITIDLYSNRCLMVLPQVPINPDPMDVFGMNSGLGAIDPSGNITRWDPRRGGVGAYVAFDPDMPQNYGGMLIGDGFWVLGNNGDQISYDAIADGVPCQSAMMDMMIARPGAGNGKGGRHIIGLPFNHPIPIDLGSGYGDHIFFSDGTAILNWGQAVDAGWVNPVMTTWTGLGYRDLWVDSQESIQPGKGYWFLTFRDNLAMIIPGN